jgi:hypothetical protein
VPDRAKTISSSVSGLAIQLAKNDRKPRQMPWRMWPNLSLIADSWLFFSAAG